MQPPANIPTGIALPSTAPTDSQSTAGFLTQFGSAVSNWMTAASGAINWLLNNPQAGPPGPAGVQGPAGPTGPAGPSIVPVGAGALLDGQLNIGSTYNAPVAATLTAGANVTITNAAGSITIAAAGGGGAATGLYNQVLSATPTAAMTGLNTWGNQQSATTLNSATGQTINSPQSTNGWNILYKTAAIKTYTVLVGFVAGGGASNTCGIGFFDGTKLESISIYINPYVSMTWRQDSGYASYTNRISYTTYLGFAPVWLRAQNDGTNLTYSFSYDGVNFLQIKQDAVTSFLSAATYFFFGCNPYGAQQIGTIMSYAET